MLERGGDNRDMCILMAGSGEKNKREGSAWRGAHRELEATLATLFSRSGHTADPAFSELGQGVWAPCMSGDGKEERGGVVPLWSSAVARRRGCSMKIGAQEGGASQPTVAREGGAAAKLRISLRWC